MSERMRDRAAKGGKARAAKLTAEQRRQIGIAGSLARWGKTLPVAEYGSSDQPLRVGGVELPCYVLEDGRRVLVQDGVIAAFDLGSGSGGKNARERLAEFFQARSLAEFVAEEVADSITSPILFRTEGTTAYGYEATVLPELCGAVLAARHAGKLKPRHLPSAEQCEVLVRAFAPVGIIALVDEATDLQATRARDELATILEALVRKELKHWVRTFPAPYYEQLYRLHGLSYPPESGAMPSNFGPLTNDIVYGRLVPGAKAELKRRMPKRATSRQHRAGAPRREEIGSPRLREHLGAVVALMKVSRDYEEFEAHLDTALPRSEPAVE